MRALLFGLAAGITLSALRAPLGLDLLSLPARSAGVAYGYRAAALAIVALGLLGAGRALEGRRSLRWIVGGAGAGLALHALLVGRAPESPAGAAALGLIALGVLVVCGRIAPARGSSSGAGGPAPAGAPLAGEVTGLAIGGAGLTLVLEGLARHLRLLVPGLPAEHGLMAAVLMALLVLGGAAFGRLVAQGPSTAIARAGFIGASGLGGLLGLVVLRGLSTPGGLHEYLDVFGLDASRAGMADYTALVAAAVLVVSGLALGAALFTLDARRQLAALLLGGAVALTLIPGLLTVELEPPAPLAVASDRGVAGSSVSIVLSGLLVALLGAGLCAAFASRAGRAARAVAFAVAALACVPILRLEAAALPITRPYRERSTPPRFTLELPEGLLAIDRSDGGLEQVTLDGRELTPPPERGALERRCIELSVALLPPERLAAGGLSVLLIGQLTPGRALALEGLGASRIDRSGSWHRAMALLERHLFRAEPAAPGRVLSPAKARRELAAGAYDLALVLAVPGEAPSTRNLASPAGTLTVVWLDGSSDLASRHLGEVLATSDLEGLAVAVAHGGRRARPEAEGPGGLAFLPAGGRLRPMFPPAWLGLARHERAFLAQRRLTERLAAARGGGGAAARALAAHFAVQRHSSPFETRAQRIELDPLALELIREAALEAPLTSLAVDLAEGLAQVLAGKRWADQIPIYLGEPAARHWPWPALERALAYAHLEALEPEAAAEQLETLVGLGAEDPELWALLGEARSQLGRPQEAAGAFSRALELAPGVRELERRLAMALVRSGDPLGPELVRELLREEPQDEELRPYLDDSNLPPVPKGYRPIFRTATSHQHGPYEGDGH